MAMEFADCMSSAEGESDLRIELWEPCPECNCADLELTTYKGLFTGQHNTLRCTKADVCRHIEGAKRLALGTDETD